MHYILLFSRRIERLLRVQTFFNIIAFVNFILKQTKFLPSFSFVKILAFDILVATITPVLFIDVICERKSAIEDKSLINKPTFSLIVL